MRNYQKVPLMLTRIYVICFRLFSRNVFTKYIYNGIHLNATWWRKPYYQENWNLSLEIIVPFKEEKWRLFHGLFVETIGRIECVSSCTNYIIIFYIYYQNYAWEKKMLKKYLAR